MKRKTPKKPRNTVGKQLGALPLIDWIQYGDLIAKHGGADATLKAVHDWQQSTRSRAKAVDGKSDHVALTDGELQFLAGTFGRALLELNADVFDQFAKAVRRYKSKDNFKDPNSRRMQRTKFLRYVIARTSKHQCGPAWTLDEWAARLGVYHRDPATGEFDADEMRTLRRILKGMEMTVAESTRRRGQARI